MFSSLVLSILLLKYLTGLKQEQLKTPKTLMKSEEGLVPDCSPNLHRGHNAMEHPIMLRHNAEKTEIILFTSKFTKPPNIAKLFFVPSLNN